MAFRLNPFTGKMQCFCNFSLAYDSGWLEFDLNETKILTHSIGGDAGNYLVDLTAIEITGTVSVHAHYHLNESSGITVLDASGNDRHGTTVNMEGGDWVAGKLNNALQFDGVDEYVYCGDIGGFERTQAFSLECWVKSTQTTAQTLISKLAGAPVSEGWMLYWQSGVLYFGLYGGAVPNQILVSATTNIMDGNWHHIVATYAGNSTAGDCHIYVDNVDKTLGIVQDGLVSSILTDKPLKLASFESLYFYKGLLDEVVIYDQELTSAEVGSRWNGGDGTEDIPGDPPSEKINNKYQGQPTDGFYLSELNNSTIKVTRGSNNSTAHKIRARIWNY